jgi:GNAT superfamily N-acetyltransferase
MGFSINIYERPNRLGNPVVEQIEQIIYSLTGVWFTEDVAEESLRDLRFQDLMCVEVEGQVVSFIIFTSSEGSISISLMGTILRHHRKGYGSALLHHLFEHVKQLGFNKIIALTVTPRSKPAYQKTVNFYMKHGFVIEKEYTELWQGGTIRLAKCLY